MRKSIWPLGSVVAPTLSAAAGTFRESSSMVVRGAWRDLRRTPARRADPAVVRTTFDPTDPEVVVNPYPGRAELRQHPVAVNERLNVWMMAGYDEVADAARAHSVLSSSSGILLRSTSMPSMVSTDEPEHSRLRRATATSFTRTAVRQLEAELEAFAAPGVELLARGEAVDIVSTLTRPLPVAAIAVILGIDRAQRDQFHGYSEAFVSLLAASSLSELSDLTWRVLPGILAMQKMIIAELRLRSGSEDDALGQMRKALEDGSMSMPEALFAARVLLVAGSENTTNLLGTMLAHLARNPDLYERIREDRELIGPATEEALRWATPAPWAARTTLEAYSVGSITIPANSRVVMMFAGANRDPDRFPDPNRFDIDRNTAGHFGFGHGTHFCLGAHLVRLEVRVALNKIMDRVDRLEIAGPIEWTTTPGLYGPRTLPLRGVTKEVSVIE